jgi:hypothetical protein
MTRGRKRIKHMALERRRDEDEAFGPATARAASLPRSRSTTLDRLQKVEQTVTPVGRRW